MNKKIKGIQISPNLITFTKCGDLLWRDGPLYCHFQDQYGDDYFWMWCESDSNYSTWLVFKMAPLCIIDFFNGKISLVDSILQNPDGYFMFVEVNHFYHPYKHKVMRKVDVKDLSNYLNIMADTTSTLDDWDDYARKLYETVNETINREKLSEVSTTLFVD